ncbi:hypothetical protein Tco_0950464 [Tanacetum coccineum]
MNQRGPIEPIQTGESGSISLVNRHTVSAVAMRGRTIDCGKKGDEICDGMRKEENIKRVGKEGKSERSFTFGCMGVVGRKEKGVGGTRCIGGRRKNLWIGDNKGCERSERRRDS